MLPPDPMFCSSAATPAPLPLGHKPHIRQAVDVQHAARHMEMLFPHQGTPEKSVPLRIPAGCARHHEPDGALGDSVRGKEALLVDAVERGIKPEGGNPRHMRELPEDTGQKDRTHSV